MPLGAHAGLVSPSPSHRSQTSYNREVVVSFEDMASPGLEPSSIEEAADQLANGPHENFERLRASIFTSSTKRRIQELQTLQSSITGDGTVAISRQSYGKSNI